jgi:hypothetical protein
MLRKGLHLVICARPLMGGVEACIARMSRLIAIACFAAAGWGLIVEGNLSAATPPAGLVAAYNFNEGSGTTVTDASGNGITGNIIRATWTTRGRYGNALSFNGSSGYVDLGNQPAISEKNNWMSL